ncbi:MAG: endolytic transglycosylase MltG [Patescibacteria group bacterium]|nr:MAG: endolytic transglycosylase MltG [Patescibacteria group bacterium]
MRKVGNNRSSQRRFLPVFAGLVLIITLLLSLWGVYYFNIKVPLAGGGDRWEQFEIERGKSVSVVAGQLEDKGIIRSALFFKLYARLNKLDRTVKFGNYWVSPALSVADLVERFQQNKGGIRLTFLEGWRREEFAAYAAKTLGRVELEEDFLRASEGKEGFLLPDTYLVPYYISSQELVELLQRTFVQKYESSLAPEGPYKVLGASLSKGDLVTLASLVERESSGDEDEMRTISGIFIKRWISGWRLDADATIQYALGYQKDTGEWWKDNLTKVDLSINSPYNTYRNTGLPPGPIASPGLAALKAVRSAKASPYWFYLHDRQGKIRYARTLEEQSQNVRKYLR